MRLWYDQYQWERTKVETEAMRLETQHRLRENELQLKRFRAQSCLRVMEKERENRRIAQKQAQNLVQLVRLNNIWCVALTSSNLLCRTPSAPRSFVLSILQEIDPIESVQLLDIRVRRT